jgi:hypothetical protein
MELSMNDWQKFNYVYAWKNNEKRITMYGRKCRVVARGKKNSVMIELENGQREIVSKYSIRMVKT